MPIFHQPKDNPDPTLSALGLSFLWVLDHGKMGLSEIVWGKKQLMVHYHVPCFLQLCRWGLRPHESGFLSINHGNFPIDGGLVRLENMENHRTK